MVDIQQNKSEVEVVCLSSRVSGSNMYVICREQSREVVLIDPGEIGAAHLIEWLCSENKIPIAVLLTHEHYDHVGGVNALSCLFEFNLYATSNCEIGIKSPKRNLSRYISIFNGGFQTNQLSIIVSDEQQITLLGNVFTVYETPGHSAGSMCILLQNYLFSGDTLLNNLPTPITLPGGSKSALKKSLRRLQSICDNNTIVYPGHGDCFKFYHC